MLKLLTLSIKPSLAATLLILLTPYLCLEALAQAGAQNKVDSLKLEQMAVELSKNHDEVIAGRYAMPPEDMFPNTAVVVVDRSDQGSGGSVRGIAYFRKYPGLDSLLAGKLVWNEATQQALLVTLKSSGRVAHLRIFRVDPGKEHSPCSDRLISTPPETVLV